jgi:hypothetical protein
LDHGVDPTWRVKDAVPGALTKDKKRLQDQEISVHLAWKSTLYVTNFPESADDAFIREIFGKVRLYLALSPNIADEGRIVRNFVRRTVAK